jgi:hypothetical protein
MPFMLKNKESIIKFPQYQLIGEDIENIGIVFQ